MKKKRKNLSKLKGLSQIQPQMEMKLIQRTEELMEANRKLSEEILKRKEIERKIRLRNALLKISDRSSSRKDYLDKATRLVKGLSGCACLGIRVLDEEGRIPYDAYTGFSEEFWRSENWLSVYSDQCACIRVIKGMPLEQDRPVMTASGSFRCGNTTEFVARLSEAEKEQFRGVCVQHGFNSVAIIPLRYKKDIVGAIHLADKRKEKVPLSTIELIEFLSHIIGEAVHKFNLEDKIHKDHSTLEAFFNHTVTPFVFLDKELNFIRVNKAYADACGRSISDFPGHNHFEFYPHQENEAIFRRVVETKIPYRAFEKPFIYPDHPEWGVTYWDWTLVPILDENNAVFLLVFALSDVTERKRSAEKLLRAQKELEQAQRLSDIGTLAATIAHELRNPLAAISIASFNLKRKSKDIPGLSKHIVSIDKKVSESSQIIDNLLFYTRLKLPHYQSIDLCRLLEECIAIIKKPAVKTGIHIVRNFKVLKNLSFEADPLQLKEIFSNILNNAYDAMEGKPGRITINAQMDSPQSIKIDFQDTGAGMDEEQLKKAHEPFFTTKAKGTGLGLAVCFQIANLHKGRIDLASVKGKGTTITVRLPLNRHASG